MDYLCAFGVSPLSGKEVTSGGSGYVKFLPDLTLTNDPDSIQPRDRAFIGELTARVFEASRRYQRGRDSEAGTERRITRDVWRGKEGEKPSRDRKRDRLERAGGAKHPHAKRRGEGSAKRSRERFGCGTSWRLSVWWHTKSVADRLSYSLRKKISLPPPLPRL